MKNRFAMLGILTIGLFLVGCDDGSGSSGNSRGTFHLRITDIPASIMSDGQSGYILIGMGPANALVSDGSNAIAGRNISLWDESDNTGGTGDNQWYEFFMYSLNNYTQKYIGLAGNYDIGFMIEEGGANAGTRKVIRNIRLEVNTLNTISYKDLLVSL